MDEYFSKKHEKKGGSRPFPAPYNGVRRGAKSHGAATTQMNGSDFIPEKPKTIIGFPDSIGRKFDKEKKTNTFFISLYAKMIQPGMRWGDAQSQWYKAVIQNPDEPVNLDLTGMLKITGYPGKTGIDPHNNFSFIWFNGRNVSQPLLGKRDIAGEIPADMGAIDKVWASGQILAGQCHFVDREKEEMRLELTLLLEGENGERAAVLCQSPVKRRISFGIGDTVQVHGYIHDDVIVPLNIEKYIQEDDFTRKRNAKSNTEIIKTLSEMGVLNDHPENTLVDMAYAGAGDDPDDPFKDMDFEKDSSETQDPEQQEDEDALVYDEDESDDPDLQVKDIPF